MSETETLTQTRAGKCPVSSQVARQCASDLLSLASSAVASIEAVARRDRRAPSEYRNDVIWMREQLGLALDAAQGPDAHASLARVREITDSVRERAAVVAEKIGRVA